MYACECWFHVASAAIRKPALSPPLTDLTTTHCFHWAHWPSNAYVASIKATNRNANASLGAVLTRSALYSESDQISFRTV